MSPRRAGPTPYCRLDTTTKAAQGMAVAELVYGQNLSLRQAAARLDMSTSTAWRRLHWVMDWLLPGRYGRPPGPIPPQRGTRACPRGRPYLPTVDGPGGPLHRGGTR